jgi:hypothetical protein
MSVLDMSGRESGILHLCLVHDAKQIALAAFKKLKGGARCVSKSRNNQGEECTMRCAAHKVDVLRIFSVANKICCKWAVGKLVQREHFGVHSLQSHLTQHVKERKASAISLRE